ncbi:MAG: hypothetical protein U0840_23395 [Gemmataceae bacterium]
MKPGEVEAFTRKLAGDWADLPPEQRAAYAFARKQAREPASITRADLAELARPLGAQKALQVAFWASRCHYMTRVADAFQLPLESDNPFLAMPGARKK